MTSKPNKVVWLSGMPRSGTTWASQVLAATPSVRVKFCPLFSYEFKQAMDENSTTDAWREFFDEVFRTPSPFMDQEHLWRDDLIPHFPANLSQTTLAIKSNRFHHLTPSIVEKNREIRFAYLIRHPAACIHSWLSNVREFPEGADPKREWRTGACRKTDIGECWGFDDWQTYTRQALSLEAHHPERIRVFEYSKLNADPERHYAELLQFFRIEPTAETFDFIRQSRAIHNPHKRSVFKTPGLDNKWMGCLPSWVVDEIYQELKGTDLEKYLSVEHD